MFQKYILILLMLIITSCSSKKITEDEQHLNMYFAEKHGVDLSDYKNYVIVVISGNCGSCTEKTIKFINQIAKEDQFKDDKKIVILPDNNASVLDSMKNASIQFIVDKGFELQKYGVNFAKNTFFEFKDGNLIYEDVLYLENIDKIAKKYNITL